LKLQKNFALCHSLVATGIEEEGGRGPPFYFGCAIVAPLLIRSEQAMPKGTVKWFNPTKGYGFIQPQGGGGRDVFVHISAVERAGLSTLNEGQSVEYEEVSNKGKTSAENLKVSR
jgi:cold shock CspA family protein